MSDMPLCTRRHDAGPKPRRRSRAGVYLVATGLAISASIFPLRSSAQQIGIGLPFNFNIAQIALTIGPVSNPIGSPAVVTFDLSGSPQLVGAGPIDGTPVILVEFGARRGGGFNRPSGVELRATAPAALQSGTNQIPFTDISWTSVLPAGAGYTDVIPSGTFAAGGPQVIATLNLPSGSPQWMGGELTFHFLNNTVYPAGTYGGAASGVVTYTATFIP
jgi:hypothetical protein